MKGQQSKMGSVVQYGLTLIRRSETEHWFPFRLRWRIWYTCWFCGKHRPLKILLKLLAQAKVKECNVY
jgi:hypothetical protein